MFVEAAGIIIDSGRFRFRSADCRERRTRCSGSSRSLRSIRGWSRKIGRFTASRSLARSLVFACSATVNRDPALFARPDEFDVTAEREVEHFSFAPGMRYCLGASLACAEIEETLVFLPSRMRNLRADGEMKFRTPSAGICAMHSVPVAFATY